MTDDKLLTTLTARADEHAKNIGLIVLALALHEPDDLGDSCINHPVTNIVDLERPAHELLEAFAKMSPETAAGVVHQLAHSEAGLEPTKA